MRKTLIESLTHGPLTEPAPKPDEAAVAELAQSVNRAASLVRLAALCRPECSRLRERRKLTAQI